MKVIITFILGAMILINCEYNRTSCEELTREEVTFILGAIILIICEGGGCGENDNDFVFAQLTREEVAFKLGAIIIMIFYL